MSNLDYSPFDFDYCQFIYRNRWITAYFELGPNETNSFESIEILKKCYFDTDWLMALQMNLEDLQAFVKILNSDQIAERHKGFDLERVPPSLFRTYYSIGFCRSELRRGDMIFAVDGVRVPLILRRHDGTSSGYRVVGECYLWAALELDYWNPGTKKGVWSSRPYDLGQVQTRMIEIY